MSVQLEDLSVIGKAGFLQTRVLMSSLIALNCLSRGIKGVVSGCETTKILSQTHRHPSSPGSTKKSFVPSSVRYFRHHSISNSTTASMGFDIVPSVHFCIGCHHDEILEVSEPNIVLPYINGDIHAVPSMSMSPVSRPRCCTRHTNITRCLELDVQPV